MTREEFDNLKVGDKVIHAFGGIGVVTEKVRQGHKSEEGMTDTAKAIEDLEKAVWYINDKIKTMKNETNNRNQVRP